VLKRLKDLFAEKAADVPMQRWDNERLEETKARLETTPPEKLTVADQHEVVDYLVQRYLPADESLTESQWQEKRAGLHAKVDANIELQRTGQLPVPEWQRLNEVRAERERILRSPYVMSMSEFTNIVLPNVSRFPLANGLDELAPPDTEALFLATLPHHVDELPEAKRSRGDGGDWLLGKVDRAVIEFCRDFRANYGWLRNAAHAGYLEVRRISTSSCGCAPARPGSRSIADVLQAIAAGAEDMFIVPPIGAQCTSYDSARVCRFSLVAEEPPNPGDDPDFAAFLKAQFQR